MEKPPVGRTREETFGMRPRYLQYNLWSPSADPMVTAAEWTLSARPLPQPLQSEYENLAAVQTIKDYPDLFGIVTPVKVDCLQSLLETHPNRVFVDSVLEGLRGDFWPWVSTTKEGYPLMLDESKVVYLSPEKEELLVKQLEHDRA